MDIVSSFVPVRSDPETNAPTLYISIDKPPPNLNENLNEYLTRISYEYLINYI
jgi:hypothetical protein